MELENIFYLEKSKILRIKDIIKQLHDSRIMKSGLKNFNELLGKGFQSGKVYLIFGSNKTGKTQICHQLCIQNCKDNPENKSSNKTYYFDCENTFRPERIKEIATEREIDYEKVLKSILVTKIQNNSVLFLRLNQLEEKLKNRADNSQSNILIIDSINNYYRLDQGDTNLAFDKVKKDFIAILNKINELTIEFNLITILTAQVGPIFFKGDKALIRENPVGIQFLNHFFSEYLYLSYNDENQNLIHLVNSHTLPEKKVLYKITSKGIEDIRI